MSQQQHTESIEKTKQQTAHHHLGPQPTRSFQGGAVVILKLQRTLGNHHVAQLINTRRLTPEGNIIGLQPKVLLQRAEDDNEKGKDRSRQSRPRNAPRGTRPIDESGLDREDIHKIKPQVGAGARDWVGITPEGDIITTDEEGNAENHGPASNYLKEAHSEIPSWAWPILITVGIVVIAGIIACFATGACEFAAVVAGLSFSSALLILALLKRAGIIDSGSETTAAAEVQDEPSEGTG